MMQGIDSSFDAVINGLIQLEASLNALIAGYYNVPVVLISGDQAAAEQAAQILGGIEVAIVKKGIGEAVITLSPAEACRLIREKAETALRQIEGIKPYIIRPPFRLEIDFVSAGTAEIASWIPGVQRESSRSISYTDNDLLKIIRLLRIITRFISLPA